MREAHSAAQLLGLRLRALEASTAAELETAFATLGREPTDALFVINDPLFQVNGAHIARLAMRRRIPGMHSGRDDVEAGGLVSYGVSNREIVRQGGAYVGRVLKGDKPADLPVVLPTRFEFIINLKTAKALGISVPQTLLVFADEVIE